jgi:hypothetical protein
MYFTCASTASCNSSGRLDDAPPCPGPETRAIPKLSLLMYWTSNSRCVNVTHVGEMEGSSLRSGRFSAPLDTSSFVQHRRLLQGIYVPLYQILFI